MATYKFVKNYNALIQELFKLRAECLLILQTGSEKSTNEFFDLVNKWEERLLICIEKHVSPKPDFLINGFGSALGNTFFDEIMHRYMHKTREGKQNLFDSLVRSKLQGLQVLNGYLFILNDINQNPLPEINTIQKKLDYLMNSLYLVLSDNFYSIEYLLDLNGIDYRDGEPEELGENLRRKGYLKSSDHRDKFVKLTVKGTAYIERKREGISKKRNQKQEDEINKKVDLVLAKLQSLGYGQEVIFNEIEELKSLSGKLNNKTWIQLLKGKVIDLAVDQVINKETASYIFETFSEGASRLLSK